MFTIQYVAISGESKMQDFDSSSRGRLIQHLSHFDRPILSVYQGSAVINKFVRSELGRMSVHNLSKAARDFVISPA